MENIEKYLAESLLCVSTIKPSLHKQSILAWKQQILKRFQTSKVSSKYINESNKNQPAGSKLPRSLTSIL